ncbi:MAG: 30S ribosomal protein S3 [Candidatus Hydrogenedentota bacterium]|nr:MAG: 30S ribosomal protein S3 [Candidatus Hydrogenedentota bacterium]
MGQKVHPNGFRVGVIRGWQARWFAPRGKYADFLHEDIRLREFIKDYLSHAMVSKVEIERHPQKVRVFIHSARPGIVIGRKGAEVMDLRRKVQNLAKQPVDISITEVRNPAVDAQLVAETVGAQLQKRVSFRRAVRKAIHDALRGGVQGIKIQVSGRLGGAEIARSEWFREGRVPLHTLRADIDYGLAHVKTTYGVIGVKVWIFTEEKLPKGKSLVGGAVKEARKRTEVVRLHEN